MILALLLLYPVFSHSVPCELAVSKNVLHRAPNGHSSEWTLSATEFSAGLPQSREYSRFLRWVREHTPWSAREILKNQIEVFRRGVSSLADSDPGKRELQKDIENEEKVLAGRLGKIRPASCLESMLFQEMLESGPMERQPSELGAIVLRKGAQLRVIGDFYYSEEGSSPGSSAASRKLLARLLAAGWQRELDLHSHPFHFNNPYGDIGGGVMPSAPDFHKYSLEKPRVAVVTNGIDSAEFHAQDIQELSRY